jgi:hypothetical protein
MKKLLLISTILIYVPFLTSAQQDTLPKSKTYKTWIKLVDGSEIKLNIDYTSTEVIKIRSGKKIRKGIAIGATTGFIFGGFVGLMGQAKRTSPEEVAAQIFGIGAFVGTCGALIGGLEGSVKIKIPINGSINNFNDNKSRLKKYSFVH